jgi:hypothetical protein
MLGGKSGVVRRQIDDRKTRLTLGYSMESLILPEHIYCSTCDMCMCAGIAPRPHVRLVWIAILATLRHACAST